MSQTNESVAKIIEITSQSTTSFQDAIEKGIARASQSLRNLRNAWVKDQEVLLKDGKISGYRVSMKLTFLFED